MLARKCDRCGRLYEAKCIKIDGEKVNSITTRVTHENENHLFGKKYDLCPNCLKELKVWLEKQQKEEHKEPIVDWGNVPIDTQVLVRVSQHQLWNKQHFAGLSEKGEVRTWMDGRTSFTSDRISAGWYYAKLWEGSEEQQAEEKEG